MKHFNRAGFGALCLVFLMLVSNVVVLLFGIKVTPTEFGFAATWSIISVGSYGLGWLAMGPVGRWYRKREAAA